ncbi:hypothetical protein CNN82_12845 [Pseudomonas frederiksbergensis]|uniref:Secreted protein n=1 Tax=Pseudomonas frederiksbergensis TaxID=104087 RepID=A0AB33EA40_9PSED|nr:hypothetical protein CNN82_12845 [Pseudomonas frederiksbergensis]
MNTLWRRSLLPLGYVAAPKSEQSPFFVSATHSSGSKLPRHRFLTDSRFHYPSEASPRRTITRCARPDAFAGKSDRRTARSYKGMEPRSRACSRSHNSTT